MYCPKCGSFLPEGTAVCQSCGETITASNNTNDINNQYNATGVYYSPQQGEPEQPAPENNTYSQPEQPAPENNTYYQPEQPAPENNTYYQPEQPAPENNTYYQPEQPAQPDFAAQNSNYFNNAPQQSQYQPNGNGFYQANQPNYVDQQIKENISTANTLGILAIVLGILMTPIAGIICGAIGLSKLNSVPGALTQLLARERDKARKLNILGIALPIGLWIISIILIFVFVMVLGFTAADLY